MSTSTHPSTPPSHHATDPPSRRRSTLPAVPVLVLVLVPVVVAVVLTMFAWPASQLAPRGVPIGVVAPGTGGSPSPAGAAIEQRLGAVLSDGEPAFEVQAYDSEAAARAAIEGRQIYGALVVSRDGATLWTASAASPAIAQLLQRAVTELAADLPTGPGPTGPGPTGPGAAAGPPEVVDVVPADTDDPRGAVLGSSVLPLVFAGLFTATLLSTYSRPGFAQAGVLVGVAVLAGLVVVGIAQGWLGAFGGDWWRNAGVLALAILAIGGGVAGLTALLGRAGLVLGVILMLPLGNPLSGITSAPELLPTWAGATGQLLPPGAGGTLLRSVAFFDGAGASQPLLVLCGWAGVGLLLVLLGGWLPRHRRSPRAAVDADSGQDRQIW